MAPIPSQQVSELLGHSVLRDDQVRAVVPVEITDRELMPRDARGTHALWARKAPRLELRQEEDASSKRHCDITQAVAGEVGDTDIELQVADRNVMTFEQSLVPRPPINGQVVGRVG